MHQRVAADRAGTVAVGKKGSHSSEGTLPYSSCQTQRQAGFGYLLVHSGCLEVAGCNEGDSSVVDERAKMSIANKKVPLRYRYA